MGGDDRRHPFGLHHPDLEAAGGLGDVPEGDEEGIAVENDGGGGVEERVVDARLRQHILVGCRQRLLEGVGGVPTHEVQRHVRLQPVGRVDVEVDLRIGVGDDHTCGHVGLIGQADAGVQAGGDREHEAEHPLLLPFGHPGREGLVESVGIGEPFRRRDGLAIAGAVEHEGVTGPVGDLERGGVGGLEGDAGAQPGVPAQPHLSVPVQSRGQIRQLVVDEREDIGDLDPVVEEEQVESPQIRRGGCLDRNRGPVPAVSGSAGRRHPGPAAAGGGGLGCGR